MFELADSNTSINVVRVMSKDRTKVYLTAFTHLVSRPNDGKLDATVVFSETPAGTPPAIKTWFPKRNLRAASSSTSSPHHPPCPAT